MKYSTNGKLYNVPKKIITVGVTIDESISNCDDMVSYPETLNTGQGTYQNMAYGATPMSGSSSLTMGSWSNETLNPFIAGIKPVSFDGSTWTDLNKTSESSWPTAQGTDCFTEFPFYWLSITKSGNVITVVFTNQEEAPDSTFQNWAFLGPDGTTQNPNFHLGCFTASGSKSGIYSRPGQSNLVSTRLNQYWYGAYSRDTSTYKYDCMPFQMWTYLQALFLVLYKTTNCQTNHSQGYVGGSAVQSNTTFSYSNNYGMYGSTQDTTTQNAFFWLHNLWGNMYQYSASLFTRANSSSNRSLYYILSSMSNPNNWDNGSWNVTSTTPRAMMTALGTDSGVDGYGTSGYFTKQCGVNGAGFVVKSDSSTGSATTYYPDYGRVNVNSSYAYFPNLGGYYNSGVNAGLFRCFVYYSSTDSGSSYGSRLAYRGGRS